MPSRPIAPYRRGRGVDVIALASIALGALGVAGATLIAFTARLLLLGGGQ